MTNYRDVSVDRREDYRRVIQYAFSPEGGPGIDETDDEWPPKLYDPRGLFDDGDLVTTSRLYEFDAWVREGWRTVGGLGAVATPPERRREGNVREILRHALDEYRERGVDLVTLWPFSTPFYRRLGWGTASEWTRYVLPPEQLSFARGGDGAVRRLTADDWERLRTVETRYAESEEINLGMRRSEQWWRERTLVGWEEDDPYVYGYEREGDLRGYVIFRIESGDEDGRALKVDQFAALDDDADRALLRFLADHDSQVASVRLDRADDGELLYRVDDPGEVECSTEVLPMVRLTDVVGGLERYPWPEAVDAEFRLAVEDPLLDRTDGTFEVVVGDGSATVRPVDGNDPTEIVDGDAAATVDADDPAATVDVGTLSQLYVGALDVDGAERTGGLTIHEDAVRDPLAAAFPSQRVWLGEFF